MNRIKIHISALCCGLMELIRLFYECRTVSDWADTAWQRQHKTHKFNLNIPCDILYPFWASCTSIDSLSTKEKKKSNTVFVMIRSSANHDFTSRFEKRGRIKYIFCVPQILTTVQNTLSLYYQSMDVMHLRQHS